MISIKNVKKELGKNWKNKSIKGKLIYFFLILQVYHMCNSRGGGRGFLCPQGTKFAQRTMVCDFEKKVKCNDASNFFHRNVIIHEASLVGNWATSRNNRIKEQKPREFTFN